MDRASARRGHAPPIEAALLAAAVHDAAREVEQHDDHARAVDAAVEVLQRAVPTLFPSVFVLEHGRLWLVSQRGYALVPDGFEVGRGILGRAVRLGRPELVADVHADPDYLEAIPAVRAELAIPLRQGYSIVGAVNLESERSLPDDSLEIVRPLAAALAPRVDALRGSAALDLSALARLFAYLGSLRDPAEIAALGAASLARVLRVAASQVWMWEDPGTAVELALWQATDRECRGLTSDEVAAAHALVDTSVVSQRLDSSGGRTSDGYTAVWLPLRANGVEIGALVGVGGAVESAGPRQLDTAAVLAAQVATSLDASLALRRERRSAMTDPLTGILNRRGLEENLELGVADAQERRIALSVLVLDCDDFKDINDRAGHEFGDALLREIADVLANAVPAGADVARLGGDEFVVVLPGAGADVAEALGGRIRSVLAEGLTDAGFPLRISGGTATYPFDGATPTAVLRAADQALYAAKDAGKDRVASFRQVLLRDEVVSRAGTASDERRGGARDSSVLNHALSAARAIESEDTIDGVLSRLCKSLVFVVGATACSASRVAGDYLVDATEHALREVSLGNEAAYRISDFPLTDEALRTGEPRAVSFADGDVDRAEAFILRELSMNAMLMVPLRVAGQPWGLIELYDMRLRRFTEDDVSIAQFLATHAEKRLERIAATEPPRGRPPVYELPSEPERLRAPRTR
jgi:diguanylate cyclase (GGDEF)-like protein